MIRDDLMVNISINQVDFWAIRLKKVPILEREKQER